MVLEASIEDCVCLNVSTHFRVNPYLFLYVASVIPKDESAGKREQSAARDRGRRGVGGERRGS